VFDFAAALNSHRIGRGCSVLKRHVSLLCSHDALLYITDMLSTQGSTLPRIPLNAIYRSILIHPIGTLVSQFHPHQPMLVTGGLGGRIDVACPSW
jgi:hypothetical protein